MRVLVLGATGMIGSRLVPALLACGHEVLLGVRDTDAAHRRWPQLPVLAVDLDRDPVVPASSRPLPPLDAVINTVGIFRSHDPDPDGPDQFTRVHETGPLALFDHAIRAGARRIVQVSALGAAPEAGTAFLASKGRADLAIAALPAQTTSLRPSLVFAPEGASSRWFALLAALPLTPLPGAGSQPVQPVHVDDLCASALAVLTLSPAPAVVEVVGPQALTVRQYLAALKQLMNLGGGFVPMPLPLIRLAAGVMARVSRSPVDTDALTMLEQGSTGDSAGLAAVLGRPPRPVSAFLGKADAAAMRRQAQLDWLLPPARWAVAGLWLVTAFVSAFVFPVPESLELLARTGITGAAGPWALYGAAGLNAVLGLGLFLAPRWRPWLYRAQIALVLFYTAMITWALPEFWAHPYGPVLKNLPILALLVILHALDRPEG